MIITFYHSLGFLEQTRSEYVKAREWYDQVLKLAKQLKPAGKLVGDDANWDTSIEVSIRACQKAAAERLMLLTSEQRCARVS